MKFEAIKDKIGLRRQRGFSDTTIDAEAKANQAGECCEVGIERTKNYEEANGSCHKVAK